MTVTPLKILPVFLIAFPAFLANAQSATLQPKFEVASVKRAERCQFDTSLDPGALALRGVPLSVVLMQAFQVRMDQIEGPSWLATDCFEISAKIPEGSTREQLPAMLQALLAERFKLLAHAENRLRSSYGLVPDKGGPKLTPEDAKTNFMGKLPRGSILFGFAGHGRLKGVMTMAALARYLSSRGYGPVTDLTGLTGTYRIDLSWAPDPAFEPRALDAGTPAAAPKDDGPAAADADLFTALRESLGLKLERRTVPIEIVVVERIERVPAEN